MAASTHGVPEKTGQRRVRTSRTNVNGITNGIVDTTGKSGSLVTLMPDFSAWQKGQGAVCSIWADACVCAGAFGGQIVRSADVVYEIYVGLFDIGTHSMYQPTQATRRSGDCRGLLSLSAKSN
ncbi:uncharacterized protein BJ212DRAFT_1387830 [Suillus subaureus]|uniref:Uncharacterized protein n=1 Tax=Suillus subaureus TaxID=48587 RepID=A0A9P7J851_9AGAM|nr:uncharacterized protein BJ212DRAFT_1387830 [Suillus subaureus]KAG1807339.1 hypothetical protein BJ212DRAFT_1387830 [Suillus subaureus]